MGKPRVSTYPQQFTVILLRASLFEQNLIVCTCICSKHAECWQWMLAKGADEERGDEAADLGLLAALEHSLMGSEEPCLHPLMEQDCKEIIARLVNASKMKSQLTLGCCQYLF